MPCSECAANHDRANRAEAAEKSLLLFVETFSTLSCQLADIEREADRKRHADNPPPPGGVPLPKRRFLLVPAELLAGLVPEAQAPTNGPDPDQVPQEAKISPPLSQRGL